VRITHAFYLGETEVTQAQYVAVMGSNPSAFSSMGMLKKRVVDQDTSNLPVEGVSWIDAVRFCNELSRREGLAPYYDESNWKQFKEPIEETFSGIGVQIDVGKDGRLRIVAPLPGSPAHQAGALAGDLITEIDGKSTQGITVENATEALRGSSGTSVTIKILHMGSEREETRTIRRGDIVATDVGSDEDRARGVQIVNIRANGYRLPTEAEWEYACRAGSRARFCLGNSLASLDQVGWYADISGNYRWDSAKFYIDCGSDKVKLGTEAIRLGCRTHAVRSLRPNAFGLFDMHGNVFEWCFDAYHPAFYRKERMDDPINTNLRLGDRVLRGGSWLDSSYLHESAYRGKLSALERTPSCGLRIARNPNN
jgi:formylglycine-generating enzyme required for sulfatase activity